MWCCGGRRSRRCWRRRRGRRGPCRCRYRCRCRCRCSCGCSCGRGCGGRDRIRGCGRGFAHEVLDRVDHRLRLEGLGELTVRTHPLSPAFVYGLGLRAHQDDLGALRVRVGLEVLTDGVAVHVVHLEIDENHRRPQLLGERHALAATRSGRDLKRLGGEGDLNGSPNGRAVIYDEYLMRHGPSLHPSRVTQFSHSRSVSTHQNVCPAVWARCAPGARAPGDGISALSAPRPSESKNDQLE